MKINILDKYYCGNFDTIYQSSYYNNFIVDTDSLFDIITNKELCKMRYRISFRDKHSEENKFTIYNLTELTEGCTYDMLHLPNMELTFDVVDDTIMVAEKQKKERK